MKTFDRPRKRVIISSNGEVFNNHEYALIHRIASVLELHDIDVVIENIISESKLMKKPA